MSIKKRWRKKSPTKRFLNGIRLMTILYKIEAGQWKDLRNLKIYPWFERIFRKAIRNKLIRPTNSHYALYKKAKEIIGVFGPVEKRRIFVMFNSFLLWEEEKKKKRKGGENGRKKDDKENGGVGS